MFYQFYLEIRIENYVFNEIDENIMKFVNFFISYIKSNKKSQSLKAEYL
jgi:ribosomal protein L1